jgi:rRNA maturation endonuclease Nob1
MTDLTSTINHLGFRQYMLPDGTNVCPNCDREYTNNGEGVLCDICGDDLEDAQNDLIIGGQW